MTKIIVQHFVENLLKVLKVLKTRTALTRNGLAEFRYAPHGRALKRLQTRGAKPGYKKRLQIYYKTAKSLKKLLTYDKIESEKERMVQNHERLQRFNRIVHKPLLRKKVRKGR